MDTFDLKKYLAEGQLHENEMDSLGDELADAIEDTLEDKKEELNEVIDPISILSYVLAGTTLTNILAKYVGKLFKKYNFGKGEAAAKKIYDFTHKNEEAFKAPIKRVVGVFTKNEKYKKIISDILYALVILGMAGQAGGDAVNYIKKAGYLKGGLYGLKSLVKGTEVAVILKGVVQDAIS